MSEVRSQLDAVQFAGGGFGPIALTQALAHVIYLQTLPSSFPVSPPLPGGGSLPAPADPVVKCHVLMLVASPADQLPVHVPGLKGSAAPPALGAGGSANAVRGAATHVPGMHTYHSLARLVRQSYHIHLSIVLLYTRETVSPCVSGCGGVASELRNGKQLVQARRRVACWGHGRGLCRDMADVEELAALVSGHVQDWRRAGAPHTFCLNTLHALLPHRLAHRPCRARSTCS